MRKHAAFRSSIFCEGGALRKNDLRPLLIITSCLLFLLSTSSCIAEELSLHCDYIAYVTYLERYHEPETHKHAFEITITLGHTGGTWYKLSGFGDPGGTGEVRSTPTKLLLDGFQSWKSDEPWTITIDRTSGSMHWKFQWIGTDYGTNEEAIGKCRRVTLVPAPSRQF